MALDSHLVLQMTHVSRQPREATAHSSTLQDTVMDCPTRQPKRLGGISALKAQQFIYLFLCSWLLPSLASRTAERGRLPVLRLGRAAGLPTHPGVQSSDVRSWCLPSRSAGFFGVAPGGTGAWKWSFCLPPEPTPSCWYFLC